MAVKPTVAEQRTANGFSIGSQVTSSVAALASAAISYHHSMKMDEINTRIHRDAEAFDAEQAFQTRQFNARMYALNRDKLMESLSSEQLAFQLEDMAAKAEAENTFSAMNNSNTSGIMRDIEKQSLRQETYVKQGMVDKLAQQRATTLKGQYDHNVTPKYVAPSNYARTVQLGSGVLQVGSDLFSRYGKEE